MFRRQFCASLAAAASVAGLTRNTNAEARLDLPPIRAITRGPKYHWRGYYDKDLFDSNDRYVLSNEVDFEGRTPERTDKLTVGMTDLKNKQARLDP